MSEDQRSPTTAVWAAADAWDDRVDEWFDALRGNPVADRIFYAASELGDHALVWHLLAAAKAARSLDNERAALRLIASLAVESALVNGFVKSLFKRSRPTVDAPRPLRLRIPRTSSFPSGHASSATMAATLLSEGSRAKGLYGLGAALVASSRVHVKIHHASDVVGGVIVGTLLGIAIRRRFPLRP